MKLLYFTVLGIACVVISSHGISAKYLDVSLPLAVICDSLTIIPNALLWRIEWLMMMITYVYPLFIIH